MPLQFLHIQNGKLHRVTTTWNGVKWLQPESHPVRFSSCCADTVSKVLTGVKILTILMEITIDFSQPK